MVINRARILMPKKIAKNSLEKCNYDLKNVINDVKKCTKDVKNYYEKCTKIFYFIKIRRYNKINTK